MLTIRDDTTGTTLVVDAKLSDVIRSLRLAPRHTRGRKQSTSGHWSSKLAHCMYAWTKGTWRCGTHADRDKVCLKLKRLLDKGIPSHLSLTAKRNLDILRADPEFSDLIKNAKII